MKAFVRLYRLGLQYGARRLDARYADEALEVAIARVALERGRWPRLRQAATELIDVWLAGGIPMRPSRTFVDVRLAARQIRRRPLPAALAAATLALGIGATTAVASVLHHVVWAPLPFADPDRLLLVRGMSEGRPLAALSAPEWRDLQAQAGSFVDFGGMWETNGILAVDGEVESIRLAWVTSNFFPLLGVDPVAGRHFSADEDAMRGPRSIIISYHTWQRHFGGRDDAVGSTVLLDDQRRTVVGVMPSDFRHYEGNISLGWNRFDAWIPNADWPNRDMRFLRTVGRLRPETTVEQGNAELERIGRRWMPEAGSEARLYARPLAEQLLGDSRLALTALGGAVTFLLLIACANAGGIARARALARERELAVRLALGASRGRVVQLVLAEAVLLVVAGGLGGLFVANLGLGVVRRVGPGDLPGFERLALDGFGFAAALVITLIAAVLFAAGPARQVGSVGMVASLRGTPETHGRHRWLAMKGLAVGSVGMAVTLLVGAGLMLRTLDAILDVDLGFARERVLTFRAPLSPAALIRQGQAAGQRNILALAAGAYQQFRDRVGALPGVSAAGAAQLLPFGEGQQSGPFAATGVNGPVEGSADYRGVLPGYFEAIGVQLLAGRLLSDDDVAAPERRVVIDRLLAGQVWPGVSPVGRTLRVALDSNNATLLDAEVVGVIEHVRAHRLREPGLPQVYLPFGKYLDRVTDMHFAVRTNGDPLAAMPAIREIFRDIAPTRPLAQVRTLDDYVAGAYGDVRIALAGLSAFAGLATVMAIAGLYGVLSFVVSRRTREFGCRVALGASREDVLRLVLRQGVVVGGAGLLVGLCAAGAMTSLLERLLFGISPLDLATFAGVGALVFATVLAASLVPAVRATRVDPIQTLRVE